MVSAEKGHAVLQLMKKDEAGKWVDLKDDKGQPKMAPVVLDKDTPYLAEEAEITEKSKQGEATTKKAQLAQGRSIAIVYAGGNSDQIIPAYISSAMPKWFGVVFLVTLLAAAMSTLSSQFHTLGTGMGRDVYEQLAGSSGKTYGATRIAIVLGILIALVISYYSRGGYIIARATAIFFGLCASAFLPTFIGGLFWKRMTRSGAIASMVVGFSVTGFWLLLVKAKEAGAIGLVQLVTGGKESILAGCPNWPEVDPLVIALPLSILVAIVVSLLTQPMAKAHVNYCFGGPKPEAR
jgi:SSS family solute:Na+ symporter